jgi:hypothetical protein
MSKQKNNEHLLFVLRKDGNKYAPFLALDKNNRKQTRYVKIKTEGISKSAIQKAKLKRLHELNYIYTNNVWKKEQPAENVLLLISIGDYKHVKFDIIIKRVFSADDFKNLIERDKTIEAAHERIRNETISQAVQLLRSKGHFGLASMLKNNEEIDYVVEEVIRVPDGLLVLFSLRYVPPYGINDLPSAMSYQGKGHLYRELFPIRPFVCPLKPVRAVPDGHSYHFVGLFGGRAAVGLELRREGRRVSI